MALPVIGAALAFLRGKGLKFVIIGTIATIVVAAFTFLLWRNEKIQNENTRLEQTIVNERAVSKEKDRHYNAVLKQLKDLEMLKAQQRIENGRLRARIDEVENNQPIGDVLRALNSGLLENNNTSDNK